MRGITLPGIAKKKTTIILLVLFTLGILVRLFYLAHTEYDERGYDTWGHVDYVQSVARSGIPDPSECWECYQPPLYYVIAAPIYSFAENLGLDGLLALQVFAFLLSLWFLGFCILTYRRLIKSDKWFLFADALTIFFPSLIIHSTRISNEPLFYLFYVSSLYALVVWWQSRSKLKEGDEIEKKLEEENKGDDIKNRNIWLYTSILLAFLSTITKATGLLMFGVIALCVLAEILEYRRAFSSSLGVLVKRYLGMFLFGVVFLIMGAAITFYHPIFNPSGNDWLIGNSSTLHIDLYVGNDLSNYITLAPDLFISEPFNNPWEDYTGRQFFPHYFLKSMLWGEFDLGAQSYQLAGLVNLLFLVIAAMGVIIVAAFKSFKWKYLPLYLSFVVLFLGELYIRLKMPTSANSDFRFILPIVITLFTSLSLGLSNIYGKWRIAGDVFLVITVVFLLLSNALLLLYA